MIDTKLFGNELNKLGFSFYSGVPCSILKDLLNYAINEFEYIAAINEGDAVATASGAYLGGKKSVVIMQNSGLTNALSPLVSLNFPFQIPVLGFVSLRGEQGANDEPQHELIGSITTAIFEILKISYEFLSPDFEIAKAQLIRANQHIERNESFFFVVKEGTFTLEPLKQKKQATEKNILIKPKVKDDQLPTRYEALNVINSLKDNQTIQVATTGKTGRELYEIEDAANNLYMVGSMGCVSSLGLGLALTRQRNQLVIIDGDGALLMRMGNLAANGYYQPPNLLHILLDNNTYDSTGGQVTVSNTVNFVDIAASCAYVNSIYVHDLSELAECVTRWKRDKKLTFLYMRIAKGSKEKLGRPKIKPYEVKDRLRKFVE